MDSGYILLCDTEGWAKLYDLAVADETRRIAEHYRHAELVGEEPGVAFHLPYGTATVEPLTVTHRGHPFDDNDYATRQVMFKRNGQKQPVHIATFSVDGRG